MELEVIFDREDRLYKFGEVISGKVVLRPESDWTYSKIWITNRLQTHGLGYRDRGKEIKVILVEDKIFLKAGECMELPFRFNAPDGPETYHGHLLNVDWYLTAHAQGGFLNRIENQQQFLLQACDPTEAVILRNKEILPEDFPARSIEVESPTESLLEGITGLPWGGILILITVGIFIYIFLDDPPFVPFIIYFLSICLLIISKMTLSLLKKTFKRKLEIGEVWVDPTTVWRGGAVHCHVDFIVKRDFHLRCITASISTQERVLFDGGEYVGTGESIKEIFGRIYTQPFNHDLSEGRRISFDCDLPVSSAAPATFSTAHNHVEWSVTMKADIKGWSEWEKTFPITVLPGVFEK